MEYFIFGPGPILDPGQFGPGPLLRPGTWDPDPGPDTRGPGPGDPGTRGPGDLGTRGPSVRGPLLAFDIKSFTGFSSPVLGDLSSSVQGPHLYTTIAQRAENHKLS